MSEFYIYKIECLLDGKVYIGQTKNLKARWKEHRSDLRAGRHHSQKLQRAWNKYGEKAFRHSIIEKCLEQEVDDRERYWISHYGSTNKHKGYNNDSGGNANKNLSKETKEKLRAVHSKRYPIASTYLNSPKAIEKRRLALSGKNNPMYGKKPKEWMGEETYNNWVEGKRKRFQGKNNPMYGKPVSQSRKELYSKMFAGENNPFYGRTHSNEAREKMRKAATGRRHTTSARAKMSLKRRGKDNPAARSVLCLTTGERFDTAKEAALFYNINPNGVRMVARGERTYAGKLRDGRILKWKYVD